MLRALPLVCVLAACADTGDEGMYVLNNTAVTGDTCAATGDQNQPALSHGTVFALSPSAYVTAPLVLSRIQASEGTEIQHTIQLRSADVKLTLKAVSIERGGAFTVTQPNTMVDQFSALFSAGLKPGASVNVFVDTIPPATLRNIISMSGANISTDTLSAEVLAEIVIKGDLNGDTVESAPFLFPVTVCNDCVVSNLGACPQTANNKGNPCNPYQDGVVDCCTDTTGRLICPASSSM